MRSPGVVGFLWRPRGQDSWYSDPTKREQGSHTLPGTEGGSPLGTRSTQPPPQAPTPCSELTWSGVSRDVTKMAGQRTRSAPANALQWGLRATWVGTTCQRRWQCIHAARTAPGPCAKGFGAHSGLTATSRRLWVLRYSRFTGEDTPPRPSSLRSKAAGLRLDLRSLTSEPGEPLLEIPGGEECGLGVRTARTGRMHFLIFKWKGM